MKALLFIESPLQLLNAFEAIHAFKITKYKMIVRLSGETRNDEQLINTLKLLKVYDDNITYIKINVGNRGILDLVKIIFYSQWFSFFHADYFFIGNADSGFFKPIMSGLNNGKVVCLDDGAKTITLMNNKNEPEHQYFSAFNLAELSKNTHYKNQYSSLKNIISLRNDLKVNKSEILFLGQKLSEEGALTEAKYTNLVINFAQKNNKFKIQYISHRGENLDKLKEISDIHNIELIELSYPVELYGLQNQTIPYKVVSFYSTALYTMKIIYGMEAESINASITHPKFKKNIDAVYKFYKESNFINEYNK